MEYSRKQSPIPKTVLWKLREFSSKMYELCIDNCASLVYIIQGIYEAQPANQVMNNDLITGLIEAKLRKMIEVFYREGEEFKSRLFESFIDLNQLGDYQNINSPSNYLKEDYSNYPSEFDIKVSNDKQRGRGKTYAFQSQQNILISNIASSSDGNSQKLREFDIEEENQEFCSNKRISKSKSRSSKAIEKILNVFKSLQNWTNDKEEFDFLFKNHSGLKRNYEMFNQFISYRRSNLDLGSILIFPFTSIQASNLEDTSMSHINQTLKNCYSTVLGESQLSINIQKKNIKYSYTSNLSFPSDEEWSQNIHPFHPSLVDEVIKEASKDKDFESFLVKKKSEKIECISGFQFDNRSSSSFLRSSIPQDKDERLNFYFFKNKNMESCIPNYNQSFTRLYCSSIHLKENSELKETPFNNQPRYSSFYRNYESFVLESGSREIVKKFSKKNVKDIETTSKQYLRNDEIKEGYGIINDKSFLSKNMINIDNDIFIENNEQNKALKNKNESDIMGESHFLEFEKCERTILSGEFWKGSLDLGGELRPNFSDSNSFDIFKIIFFLF